MGVGLRRTSRATGSGAAAVTNASAASLATTRCCFVDITLRLGDENVPNGAGRRRETEESDGTDCPL